MAASAGWRQKNRLFITVTAMLLPAGGTKRPGSAKRNKIPKRAPPVTRQPETTNAVNGAAARPATVAGVILLS
jgi:hypothetical protein